MSKIREILTEKTHPFLEAWEQTYIDSRRLKDMLGLMLQDEGDEEKYKELLKIVSDLDKFYTQNTKKVMQILKKGN